METLEHFALGFEKKISIFIKINKSKEETERKSISCIYNRAISSKECFIQRDRQELQESEPLCPPLLEEVGFFPFLS